MAYYSQIKKKKKEAMIWASCAHLDATNEHQTLNQIGQAGTASPAKTHFFFL